MTAMRPSCLKARCPACRAKIVVSADDFARLVRDPAATIAASCAECTATATINILGRAVAQAAPLAAPPSFPPVVANGFGKPVVADRVPALPLRPTAVIQASAPPPFGLLGEDRAHASPANAAAPFTPTALPANPLPRRAEKRPGGFDRWWRSLNSTQQWAFTGLGVAIAAAIVLLPGGGAVKPKKKTEVAVVEKNPAPPSTSVEPPLSGVQPPSPASVESAVPAKQTPPPKKSMVLQEAPVEVVEKETKSSKSSEPASHVGEPYLAILCDASGPSQTGAGGMRPLAAAWAFDGNHFVVRATKAFAEIHAKGEKTTKNWRLVTAAGALPVVDVIYHPKFPAAELRRALKGKRDPDRSATLLRQAESYDVAALTTKENVDEWLDPADPPRTTNGPTAVKLLTPEPPTAVLDAAAYKVRFREAALESPLNIDLAPSAKTFLRFPLQPGVDGLLLGETDGAMQPLGLVLRKHDPRNQGRLESGPHQVVALSQIRELLEHANSPRVASAR